MDVKFWNYALSNEEILAHYNAQEMEIKMNDDDAPDFDINPEDFEGEESLAQIARMGLSIYRALKRDGALENEAFTVTSAFFAGFAKGTQGDD